jgi:3-phosphoshikimate 1-carboxyvinyltransferase
MRPGQRHRVLHFSRTLREVGILPDPDPLILSSGQKMKNEAPAIVRPARNVRGSVQLPGDKSISHRYAMLAGIAEGPSRLENYSTGADCASTLGCMRALGVNWERNKDNVIEVQGRGLALAAPTSALDCGNSGSTMRMLSGIMCRPKILQRNGRRRVALAPPHGARHHAPHRHGRGHCLAGGKAPAAHHWRGSQSNRLRHARGQRPGESPVSSSPDYSPTARPASKSHCARVTTAKSPSEPSAPNSIAKVMVAPETSSAFAADSACAALKLASPATLSSAAFFLSAAALFPGSQLTLPALLMNPTRARLLDVLMQIGLRISVTQLDEIHGELVGSLQVEGAALKGATIAGADSAALIDEIPVLAAIAPFTPAGN